MCGRIHPVQLFSKFSNFSFHPLSPLEKCISTKAFAMAVLNTSKGGCTTLWMVPECPVCQMPSSGACCSLESMLQKSLCQLYKLCKFIHELIMSDVSDPKVWLKLAIDLINHDLIAWHIDRFPNIDPVAIWHLRKGASITVSLLTFSSICLFIDPLLSHQNIAGTQGNYEKTKNANENAKATKYCAQQQKWYMNYCRIW